MRCVIDREALSKSLRLVQGVVEARVPLPVASHLLLATEGPALRLTGTDLETTVRVSVPGEALAQGQVALPGQKFAELVRELPALPVTLDAENPAWITVTCGSARYRLAGAPPEDFPAPEAPGEGVRRELPADTLQAMLAQTRFAVSLDSHRAMLNGLLFELGDGALTLVATDGHRLARARRSAEGGPDSATGIVPRKAVQQIGRLLSAGQTAKCVLTERLLTFTMPGSTLTTRLIEGQFPDYRRVIPPEHPMKLTMARSGLIEALRRVAILAESPQRGIQLGLSAGSLRLSSTNPELGEAEESLPVEYGGEALAIGVNAGYLLDALEPLEADGVVIEVKDPLSPILLHPEKDTETLSVIMPLRL
jgi:DNA polymerase-3 subunit beta